MTRFWLAALGLLLLILFVRPTPSPMPAEEWRLAMDTAVKIQVYAESGNGRTLLAAGFSEIHYLDSLMNNYSEFSEISAINRSAAAEPVVCSDEMAKLLTQSLRLARASRGSFDVALGSLTNLWNVAEALSPPEPAEIAAALEDSGWPGVSFDGTKVGFAHTGLQLDLGAVAKGFAVDQAVAAMRSAGASAGLIEAGGDLFHWGEKPDKQPWRFGVQHPRNQESVVLTPDLGLPAIATSGDYERYFEYEGERYHHLLDPVNGYPARRSVSATVWAQTAMDADILATAVFVMGPEAGVDWVDRLPNTEALVFYEKNGVLRHRTSSGLRPTLDIVEKSAL